MNKFKGRVAILGSGNIGVSLAKGLVKSGYAEAGQISLTRRSAAGLTDLAEQGFAVSTDNAAVVANADIVVLAVLPQQLNNLLAQIGAVVDVQKHVFISVASGVSCADIRSKIGEDVQVVRAMPNTAIAIGQSMTCVATDNASQQNVEEVTRMFETVGSVVKINEDLMTSATALCACGIAFFLRAIRAASQGGVEIGFHADEALKMAVQTAKGAADLLLLMQSHPEQEIDKVTSPKGCTIAGLNEMEHNGFSSSLIKGIKLSAIKAGALYTKE
ncbi:MULTISPECIES: pyrroline-5-carboxylate reductase [Pedobacter]|uniref:Pyrroline-5-carboxylate reductase n=1 Tax=Pedobacter heparinus (strain ATCC 13125 / DSM 2366 / CIP 104194 / JCM 7457 / NBRC 12017 / NCIMB 9290 / NRRL B-14731 / HIM 762-3) TaxID=485917 RepID=C6XX89_PEDHD|nr:MULTISPECIES: pyrroline-5-carboxylate reductase [Pedobacter]ACU06395.1 pyrroline-5-carboxylate reductase [Pedobacter heparinus DSM 2366]MBB5437235.1 pyrroline-5-carboxylate reductase [Pedobacter sp. AK017]